MSWIEERAVAATPRWVIDMARHARTNTRNWVAAHRYGRLVSEIVPGAVEHKLLAANDDAVVIRVITNDKPSTILKIATSDTAAEQAVAESAALEELAACDSLGDWRTLTAKVEANGRFSGGTWFTQSLLPGIPMSDLSLSSDRLVDEAVAALVPLHAASLVSSDCDDKVLQELVRDPLDLIAHWRPKLVDQLGPIEAECRHRLAGTKLVLARQHGDFAPPNVLWDDSAEAVSGIVDWKLAQELLPPELDYVHYALSVLMLRRGEEYGASVISMLGDIESGSDGACVLLANDLGPNDLDVRTAVILAWMQHVAFGLNKARRQRTNPIWLHNNIDVVVEALQPTQSA